MSKLWLEISNCLNWLLVGCQKGVQFYSLVSAPLINTAENRQSFILQQKFKAFYTALVIPHYHSKSYIIIRMNFYYFYHNN